MNKDKIHHKETHGTSSNITEKTSVENVKGPNLLERAKEEVEALIGAVHDKMERHSSPLAKDGNLLKLRPFHLIIYLSKSECKREKRNMGKNKKQ
jgi:hypothetical protein